MAVNIGKKQNYKNLAMNILAYAIQFVIGFYISPVIVSKVGASAYGFIGLANDFVSYASIIATVFNSAASRFIANAYYRKEYDRANSYFNSLIMVNLILAGILGIAGIVLVPTLDKLLSIPTELLFDVKLTFALIFGSYIVSLVTLVFTTSTFVTNRTDVQGIRNVIQYIIRFALIIIFLNFVSVHIYWVALATLIATVVIAVMNVNLTKRLTPEISVDLGCAKRSYVAELAKSGGWMAFTSISTLLLRGLDLTIANITIGDYEMGLLSVARTMPNNVTSIISTVAPIFTPVFITYFARNEIDALVQNVKNSIKTMALILFVPITGFIVFSYDFYALWQRSLNEQELMTVTILSILTVVQAYFNASTSTMAQLSVVTNQLRLPAMVSLLTGVVSVVSELLLIYYTDLGIYAIVLMPTVVTVVRYIVFNSIYAAYCLKKPLAAFLPTALKTWLTIPVLAAIMYAVKRLLPVHSWMGLLLDAGICVVLGYALMILLFGRSELKKLLSKLLKKN